MRKIAGTCLIAFACLTGGCASIVSNSHYPVTVNSSPDGVRYTIKNVKRGHDMMSGVTPATINLPASEGFFSKANYLVTFEKPGYDSVTFPLSAGIDGWYFGNILFGGLLGILIIDPATGSMWRLEDHLQVSLMRKPDETIALPDNKAEKSDSESLEECEAVMDEGLSMMTIDQVPLEYRERLVRIR